MRRCSWQSTMSMRFNLSCLYSNKATKRAICVEYTVNVVSPLRVIYNSESPGSSHEISQTIRVGDLDDPVAGWCAGCFAGKLVSWFYVTGWLSRFTSQLVVPLICVAGWLDVYIFNNL